MKGGGKLRPMFSCCCWGLSMVSAKDKSQKPKEKREKRKVEKTNEEEAAQRWPFISQCQALVKVLSPLSIAQITRQLFANWIFIAAIVFAVAFSTKFLFRNFSIAFIGAVCPPFSREMSSINRLLAALTQGAFHWHPLRAVPKPPPAYPLVFVTRPDFIN